jgi:DNA-binding transcriptional LysR family regulator
MPLRFTLRQLEYFVAVGEGGSVAAAARRLNVSSPSISAAVAQLEAEFGVALFVRRHARGLALTTAGRRLLVEARRVLGAGEALVVAASDLGAEVAGPLAIGCLQTFAPLVLPELRRQFEAGHPAVAVSQFELDHADILEGLMRGAIDPGLTYDLSIPDGVAFEPLATLGPWVMLPSSHPLAGRPALKPEDLAGEGMVLLDLPYSADYFLELFERIGAPPKIAERTRDMAVLRALVANGYGYSLTNARTVSEHAPDGKRLAFVPLVAGMRPLQLGLATAAGAFRRSAAAAFREHCRATIRARGVPGCLGSAPPAPSGPA